MVLRKYRAKEQQLPKILVTDPMAKYLGARKGNLVKIIRDSTTAGEYVVYRLAI
jgi:DNA-directed RNA polymerase I, II, and III subunit RPABC1